MGLLFLIYIINILNPIHNWLTTISVISFVAAIVIYFFIALSFAEDGNEELRKKTVPYANFVIKILIFSSVLGIVVPNEKTAYMMTAGYIAQHIAQSDAMDKAINESTVITNKIVTIVNKKLDSYIDESTKEIEKQVAKNGGAG